MAFHDDDQVSNESANPTLGELLANLSRRRVLTGGLGAAGLVFLGCDGDLQSLDDLGIETSGQPLIGFTGVPISTEDTVVVPEGYVAEVLYAWGDPTSDGPPFAPDASNSAADQEKQAGMHHDGIHFFPLDSSSRKQRTRRGLLVMNHEYTDDGLLHVGGMVPWTAAKVRKSQAAHGVSVIEIEFRDGKWKLVRPSHYARRITANTPMLIAGPAAGDPLMCTAADPTGRKVLGTLNNCAYGATPWGTYLACEENWNGYFVNATNTVPEGLPADVAARVLAGQKRYGFTATGAGYRWHEHDARFDAAVHYNEPHRFGWVVEIDPKDRKSTPVKRTALGRIKHEGACAVETWNGRVVVYMGDDERFEYIYKFVSTLPWRDHLERAESPLDHGILYVAKLNDDGTGRWLPLVHGRGPLTAANGFNSQADVVIDTRRAADLVGATKMDRPEWISAYPDSRRAELYVTLTNNNQRGTAGRAPTDAPNPRPTNVFGHILRWEEDRADYASVVFKWDIFVLAGDPASPDPTKQGNIQGDAFGSPDGLWFDPDGRLWIQTDVSTSTLGMGDYANLGNNQMLVADPTSKEIRRFLTGPRGCEITGVIGTPDRRTLFVNIQHPGEPASERNDPAAPQAVSSWPDGAYGGRPRAATIAIRRRDGGVIGT
jgi:secreted PhoX family phosphatase